MSTIVDGKNLQTIEQDYRCQQCSPFLRIDGIKIAKVKVRTDLIPQVGDKFSSSHGQKGVVGAVVEEADLPFTSNGIKPDFILNPHSIPSRMTLGHMLESVTGKLGSVSGKIIDGTVFYVDNNSIFELLKEYGFRPDGKETFYDGITGRSEEHTSELQSH